MEKGTAFHYSLLLLLKFFTTKMGAGKSLLNGEENCSECRNEKESELRLQV